LGASEKIIVFKVQIGMTLRFRSTVLDPFERGMEFGKAHRVKIRNNIAIYTALFEERASGPFDLMKAGQSALDATLAFAPALYQEMLGMALGAGVEAALIGMLNARTEILAVINGKTRGECSAVIYVSAEDQPPIAIQTWDWFYALKDSWLVWEIPLADGSVTKTMTEYGIVGKSGMNTRGLGVLFTILHHTHDGRRMGVPVHVVSRWVLDTAPTLSRAAQLAGSADICASSSLNLVSFQDGVAAAITVELNPLGPGMVLPLANGFLIHTNHFLAPEAKPYDTEPKSYPDTLLRHNLLLRRTAALRDITSATVMKAMASHAGQHEAVCCHHNPVDEPSTQYETLATVVIDFANGALDVHAGGPCSHKLLI
jgi:isopenicillin-N N-acyltransferase like protein